MIEHRNPAIRGITSYGYDEHRLVFWEQREVLFGFDCLTYDKSIQVLLPFRRAPEIDSRKLDLLNRRRNSVYTPTTEQIDWLRTALSSPEKLEDLGLSIDLEHLWPEGYVEILFPDGQRHCFAPPQIGQTAQQIQDTVNGRAEDPQELQHCFDWEANLLGGQLFVIEEPEKSEDRLVVEVEGGFTVRLALPRDICQTFLSDMARIHDFNPKFFIDTISERTTDV